MLFFTLRTLRVPGVSWLTTGRSLHTLRSNNIFTSDFSHLRQPMIWRHNQVRHKLIFSRRPQNFTPKNQTDNVPKAYELIYVNNMNILYFVCQVCNYILLIPAGCYSAYLMWNHRKEFKSKFDHEELNQPFLIGLLGLCTSLAMALFTNSVCRRAAIRMYRHPDKPSFYAVYQRWYVLRDTMKFTDKDCKPISYDTQKKTRTLGGNIRIKNKDFLIRDTDFRNPIYYNELMGWQRAEQDRSMKTDDDVYKLYKKYK